MPIATLVIILIIVGVGLAGFRLGSQQLPPPSVPSDDRRLAEQAERIELLESELQRLKDQADFTERLLAERSSTPPEEPAEGDATD